MNSHDITVEVEKLDAFLRGMKWVDFEVEQYSGDCLTIKGSIDPSGLPDIRIYFEGVFCACLPFEWKTDTSLKVFGILQGELAIQVNLKFRVEQGHHLFYFSPEDYPNGILCLIAAERFSWLPTSHQQN